MEVALISASSHSGRLEQALNYLSEYFGTLGELRASIIKKLIWPVIQLHIGVVAPANRPGWSTSGQLVEISACNAARSSARDVRLADRPLFPWATLVMRVGANRAGGRSVPCGDPAGRRAAAQHGAQPLLRDVRDAAAGGRSTSWTACARRPTPARARCIRGEIERIIPQVRAAVRHVGPLLAGRACFRARCSG